MTGERCYVALGANLSPEVNIALALDRLAGVCSIVGISTFFRTPAIDRPEQPDYLNGVALLCVAGTPLHFKLRTLRRIAAELGRERGADPYAARTIDLDILLYAHCCMNTPELTLPDTDIRKRPFLAAALLELNPELVMPDTGRRLADEIDPAPLAQLISDTAFSKALQERFIHEC